MSDIINLVPNKWVSEDLLIALTGLTKHVINLRARSLGLRDESTGITPVTASRRTTPLFFIIATKSTTGLSVSARRSLDRNLLK